MEKFKIINNILKKNKNKSAYFKKFHHSDALFAMALMGHHTRDNLNLETILNKKKK